jgi:hypothetical protein
MPAPDSKSIRQHVDLAQAHCNPLSLAIANEIFALAFYRFESA